MRGLQPLSFEKRSPYALVTRYIIHAINYNTVCLYSNVLELFIAFGSNLEVPCSQAARGR